MWESWTRLYLMCQSVIFCWNAFYFLPRKLKFGGWPYLTLTRRFSSMPSFIFAEEVKDKKDSYTIYWGTLHLDNATWLDWQHLVSRKLGRVDLAGESSVNISHITSQKPTNMVNCKVEESIFFRSWSVGGKYNGFTTEQL